MVDGAMVGLHIAVAQVLQAINVMRMPVPEMFNLAMLVLDFPENLFLVLAILKKTDS